MIDRIESSSVKLVKNKMLTNFEKKYPNGNMLDSNTLESSNYVIDKKQIEDVVKGLNDFLSPSLTSLKFEFHEKLNEYYVTLVDDQTNEVVKEIPSKKMLDFYAEMTEFIGLLVDKKI